MKSNINISILFIIFVFCGFAAYKNPESIRSITLDDIKLKTNDPVEAYNLGNFGLALDIFKPAAEMGDPRAQFYMGAMYYNGQGVPQDYIIAYMWMALSKKSGSKAGKEGLNLVKSKMNSNQISAGDALVEKWIKKYNATR